MENFTSPELEYELLPFREVPEIGFLLSRSSVWPHLGPRAPSTGATLGKWPGVEGAPAAICLSLVSCSGGAGLLWLLPAPGHPGPGGGGGGASAVLGR